MRTPTFTAVLLVALGVAACGPDSSTRATDPLSGDVPTYRGDAARTGVMPGPGPTALPPLAWTFQAESAIRSSVAVVADTVFVASSHGSVFAIELGSGIKRWTADVGSEIGFATPLVHAGTVIVGDHGGVIHALDAATGDEVWRTSTDGPIAGAAAASAGLVFAATETGSAYALEPMTGELRWSRRLSGGVSRSMAAAGELVYFPVSGGMLAALRAGDGAIAWEAQVAEDGDGGTPTVAEGLVFAATGLDNPDPATRGVVALDAGTGELRWRRTGAGGDVLYAPAVSGGRAYIVGEDESVAAVDAATGEVDWSVTTGAANDALPSIWNSSVYVATTGGSLQALDAETGRLEWSVEIVGVPYSPVVTGGLVLVGTNVGVLYAFGIPTT